MRYTYDGNFIEGIFLNRPNRFIGEIQVGEETVICHVKNTGRMREILVPGKRCWLKEAENKNRKTKYDLISVEHDGIIVNADSQIPNKVIEDAFLNKEIKGYEDIISVKREYTVGDSRLDMKVTTEEGELFVEVKGVDLMLEKGHAKFPDAVTARGTKHLRELEKISKAGKDAMIIFLIVREDAIDFRPNYDMDPVFSNTFYEVLKSGVKARAYRAIAGPDFIEMDKEIPILPEESHID